MKLRNQTATEGKVNAGTDKKGQPKYPDRS